MRTLGVIVARGGSKRLPGKNVRPLAGKPMIAWTVEAALNSRLLEQTIVSTDDEAIAIAARQANGNVPFLRPAALSTDTASPIDVLRHAVDFMDRQDFCADTVVLLQATSPFRLGCHIDDALTIFQETAADTVTAVVPAAVHPYWAWTETKGQLHPFFTPRHMEMNRYDLPPAFTECGAIYVVRRDVLNQGTLYGKKVLPYHIPPQAAVDVDTLEDFIWAEYLFARQGQLP